MKKLVLDTSVLIKWFTKEKDHLPARSILDLIKTNKITVILPSLVKYEFGNAFLKSKKFSLAKINEVFKVFYSLPLNFVDENQKSCLLTYKIAEKLNITYYDACFLSLAKQEKATLVTADPKHQKKIKGIKIINLKEYENSAV